MWIETKMFGYVVFWFFVALFHNFTLTFSIDKMKQKIVDSWPQYIDDSLARKDWDWQPNHNLDKAFSDYLIPNLWKE